MKEQTILFRPDMARAYAEGRKDVTSRVIKYKDDHSVPIKCPYGSPGDNLRLLTTWAVHKQYDGIRPLNLPRGISVWSYFQNVDKPPTMGRLRPGSFLPGFMRHWMPCPKIIDIRDERVQDIDDAIAKREGVEPWFPTSDLLPGLEESIKKGSYRNGFRIIWEEIHGEGAWYKNEYVWRIFLENARGT